MTNSTDACRREVSASTPAPMDAETLAALKGSIEKWKSIVAGTGEDDGCGNCALCRKFHRDYRKDGDLGCTGCPVKEATGRSGCRDSPYTEYDEDPCDENAQAELDFLKSLLPAGESL